MPEMDRQPTRGRQTLSLARGASLLFVRGLIGGGFAVHNADAQGRAAAGSGVGRAGQGDAAYTPNALER
jgi:hypothetical protein